MLNNFDVLLSQQIQQEVQRQIAELKPKETIVKETIIKENLEDSLKLYSVKDLSKIWHLSEATIRKLISKGYLKAIKFSSQGLKISAMEVARFIKEYQGQDFEKLLKDC